MLFAAVQALPANLSALNRNALMTSKNFLKINRLNGRYYAFLRISIHANEKRIMGPSRSSRYPFVCLSEFSFSSSSNRPESY